MIQGGSEQISSCPTMAQLAGAVPRFRKDLVVTPRIDGRGTAWFMIEDSSRHTFHRLGLAEYELLLALDHAHALDEARQIAADRQPHLPPLSPSQTNRLIAWAAQANLLQPLDQHPESQSDNVTKQTYWNRLVVFPQEFSWNFLKGTCDRLFATPIVVLMVFYATLLASLILQDFSRFVQDAAYLVHPGSIWILLVVWLGLKCIHELGHLAAATRYGCRIGDVGFVWMLVAPVAFVDLTDIHRLSSRRSRIAISLGGVYFEWLAACVAMTAWLFCHHQTTNHWLVSIAISASVGSLLFNLNPLIRLDGYHVLADWLNRPQLATDGQRLLNLWSRRIAFGERSRDFIQDRVLLVYAIASFIYRWALLCGLIAAAAQMYGTFIAFAVGGFVVAIASLQVWHVIQAIIAVASVRPAILVRCVVLGLSLTLPVALASFAWHQRGQQFYGIVEFMEDAPLRVTSDGVLIRVLVENLQTVKRGQPLLELENLSLVARRKQTEQELEAGEMRALNFRQLRKASEEASENRANEAIRQRLADLRHQEAGLIVTSPRDGKVFIHHTELALGAWYHEGDELVWVVDPLNKKVIAAVPPKLKEHLSGSDRFIVSLGRLADSNLTGTLKQISSQATEELPHAALAARAGGPIAVQDGKSSEVAKANTPYVAAEFEVSDPQTILYPGQTVKILIDSGHWF